MRLRSVAFIAATAVLAAGAAQAKMVHFMADLSGKEESPANTSAGKGMVMGVLDTDTKKFDYTVTYEGLSGPAGAAHFHGPAAPGANAGPTLPVTVAPGTIKGSATLTDAQIADLTAGKWYFNIHTAAHPGGEVRGQLKAQ